MPICVMSFCVMPFRVMPICVKRLLPLSMPFYILTSCTIPETDFSLQFRLDAFQIWNIELVCCYSALDCDACTIWIINLIYIYISFLFFLFSFDINSASDKTLAKYISL